MNPFVAELHEKPLPRQCSIGLANSLPAFEPHSTIWPPTSQIPGAQGPRAYAQQMAIDHPEVDRATALADAVTAVESFCSRVKAGGGNPGEQSSRADPRGAA